MSGTRAMIGAEAGPDVHARSVVPEKERLSAFHGLVDKIEGNLKQVFFDRLHSLACEGARVLALLFAPRAETRVGRRRVVRR